jgi:DNA-binding GntR family transcriptional regulator
MRSPKSNLLKVVKVNQSLRTMTVDALRNAILQLHFRPGQRLIERELCEQTGVSRTSIREALRHLESEGLVETIPNKGPIVARVSLEAAREIYEVRAPLESALCRFFTERASESEIAALSRTVDALETAIEKRDLAGAQSAKDSFFDVLYMGSGNEIGSSMSRTLRARVNFLSAEATGRWNEANGRNSIKRRRKIVSAIRKRDADAAAAAYLEHLDAARKTSCAILETQNSSPALFAAASP